MHVRGVGPKIAARPGSRARHREHLRDDINICRTRIEPCTPWALPTWCTCSTRFRRSRRRVSLLRNGRSISSANGSLWRSSEIWRGAKEMAKKNRGIKVEPSSGNVFADLGFPDLELELFKATLMLQIWRCQRPIRRPCRSRAPSCPRACTHFGYLRVRTGFTTAICPTSLFESALDFGRNF